MDMNFLASMWAEIVKSKSECKRRKKNSRELCAEYIKNHSDTPINDASVLNECFDFYVAYNSESNVKVKQCMKKILETQNNICNIRRLYKRVQELPERCLDDIIAGKMSLKTAISTSLDKLIGKQSDTINPNHLKDDSKPVVTGEMLMSCLKEMSDMFVGNVMDTISQAQVHNVNKSVVYKDICTEMLSDISKAIKSLETVIS